MDDDIERTVDNLEPRHVADALIAKLRDAGHTATLDITRHPNSFERGYPTDAWVVTVSVDEQSTRRWVADEAIRELKPDFDLLDASAVSCIRASMRLAGVTESIQ